MRREKGTGAVVRYKDERGRERFRIIIEVKGKRKWKRLPVGTIESEAHTKATEWSARAKSKKKLPPAIYSPTFEQWVSRWLAWREERGLMSIADDRQRLRDHVFPVFRALEMRSVTRADIRKVVEELDEKVRRGDLRWKTAFHVWTLVRVAFRDARQAKRAELVVRDDDPTEGVAPPDRGPELARTYLYPSEFRKLIECKLVPVHWRRLYALAAYTLARAGELVALRWDAVDLDRGVILLRQARDRRDQRVFKGTKGKRNRRIPIELAIRPLLRTLKAEAEATGSHYVVHVYSKAAENLREHLKLAGVTRTELFAPPAGQAATWAPITFHDLRGTGVTWMALRGDEPLVIQQRAGHKDFATTQRYLREAECLGQDAGEPFPPLPADLVCTVVEPSEVVDVEVGSSLPSTDKCQISASDEKHAEKQATPTGIESESEQTSEPPGEETAGNSTVNTEQECSSSDAIDSLVPGKLPASAAALRALLSDATAQGDWAEVARLAGLLAGN